MAPPLFEQDQDFDLLERTKLESENGPNTVNLTEAIEMYRRSDYADVNSCSCYAITPKLAAQETLNGQQRELVDTLSDGIAKQDPLTEERILFRGTSASVFAAHPGEDRFVYRPFMSASKRLLEAMRFLDPDSPALLTLVAPPGCRMLRISDSAVACLENEEVLLQKELTISVDELPWSQWSATLNEADSLAFGLNPPPQGTRYFRINLHC